MAADLLPRLGADAYVTDWTRSHANFFRAVQIEKNVMFIILLLIVAVAAFNIVSTLVMAVTDKQPDIAILRTLGAAPAGIMAVFIVQGALIGVIGTLIGVGGGVLLALNIDVVVPFIERLFDVHFLAKDVYYISELPSRAGMERRHHHRRGVVRAEPAGDAVSELARLARESGGGAAL